LFLRAFVQNFGDELAREQVNILRHHRDQQLQDEPLCCLSIFAARDDLAEDCCHFVSRFACNLYAVVSENRRLPNRQKKIERSDVVRQLGQCDAIDWVEKLRIEIVDPKLIEIAEDHEWRPMRNDVAPLVKGLVVISLQFFTA
jgi:hypothetical protein